MYKALAAVIIENAVVVSRDLMQDYPSQPVPEPLVNISALVAFAIEMHIGELTDEYISPAASPEDEAAFLRVYRATLEPFVLAAAQAWFLR